MRLFLLYSIFFSLITPLFGVMKSPKTRESTTTISKFNLYDENDKNIVNQLGMIDPNDPHCLDSDRFPSLCTTGSILHTADIYTCFSLTEVRNLLDELDSEGQLK